MSQITLPGTERPPIDVTVGGWAWIEKRHLSGLQVEAIRHALTIQPRKVGDHPGDPPPKIHLFCEMSDRIGVAREYFLERQRPHHNVILDVTEGDKVRGWPTDIMFAGKLRQEQDEGVNTIVSQFKGGRLGGLLRAVPGWGKTVGSLAIACALKVPTLVVVHKEFLMNQWRDRILGAPSKKDGEPAIQAFLPDAQVGFVQQDMFDVEGKHIVLAMVHSLVEGEDRYPSWFWSWPGLVITDEVHRIGASTWSRVPPKFRARWRLGVSATPRRKDGADDVFRFHIGPMLFVAKEQRMKPKIRRVWTAFQLVKSPNFNPALIKKVMLLRFLCANRARNRLIVEQLDLAVRAGRRVLVLSERLDHLTEMETMFRASWPMSEAMPTIGHYIGGMKEKDLDESAQCRIIFATSQYAQEGLDIPPLDTLFLTTPLSDVEQACGRILRPWEGKKDPVVVDFRDDEIGLCARAAEYRDKLYAQIT